MLCSIQDIVRLLMENNYRDYNTRYMSVHFSTKYNLERKFCAEKEMDWEKSDLGPFTEGK